MLDLGAVSPGYPVPDYLYNGQTVFTSFDGRTIVRCKVVRAFGDAAWVADEKAPEEERLVSRWRLRVKRETITK